MAQILIVDDDPSLLKLVGLLMNKLPAQTLSAANGKTALDLISSARPDLVILDLMLPDMDGFEILRRIRAQPALDALPVLILSAKADPSSIRVALDSGADGYVTKPYIASNLVDRVRTLLSSQRTLPA
ncbi:MAG TPA: response regulator [Aggregatilineales bacterium]|nr:response regulator [Aggregatilineales bacterium]